MHVTEDDELKCEPDGGAAGRQLVAAVDAGVLQPHAADRQLTPSTLRVTAYVVPRRELPAKVQSGVYDQRLDAGRPVVEPAERRRRRRAVGAMTRSRPRTSERHV